MKSSGVFKFGLLILYSLILAVLAFSELQKFSLEKVDNFFNYTNNYSPLKIPEKIRTSEQNEQIINLLNEVSNNNGIQYLKKVDDMGYYIKDEPAFEFLSRVNLTLYISNAKNIDIYKVPMGKSTLTIDTIDSLIEKNEFEGQFFFQTLDEAEYNELLQDFRTNYNTLFKVSFKISDFADFNHEESYVISRDNDLYNVASYLRIGIIFFLTMLVFWITLAKKKILIFRSNGYSFFSILNSLLGKTYIIAVFFLLLATISFYSRITNQFSVEFALRSLVFTIITYGWLRFTLATFVGIVTIRSESQFKINRVLNRVIPIFTKLVFLLLLVVSSLDFSIIILNSTTNILQGNSEKPNEILNEDYYVFYPVVAGKNSREFIYDKEYRLDEEEIIYEEMNTTGSILVNIDNYMFDTNEIFGRDILINPNYLKKFEIRDEDGQIVAINENEQSRILLVPASTKKNKADFDKIKNYFLTDLKQYDQKETKIIYIEDEQPIYSFVPNIGWIHDYPFLNVVTLGNSGVWEKNIINGSQFPPLKIKMNNGTKQTLSTLLTEIQMDDNLPSLIEYEKSEETFIKRTTGSSLFLISMLILNVFSFSAVIIFTTLYQYKYSLKRYLILRMNGFSFMSSYRGIFENLLLEVFFGLLIAFILSEISAVFLLNIVIAMIFNFVLVSIILLYIETKKDCRRI